VVGSIHAVAPSRSEQAFTPDALARKFARFSTTITMPYPELFVAHAKELTSSREELRSAEDVDAAVKTRPARYDCGEFICGCAAGKRGLHPMALPHLRKPSRVETVFAGRRRRSHRSRPAVLHGIRASFRRSR